MRTGLSAVALLFAAGATASDVVDAARAWPDGGGYHWTPDASGVTRPVTFRGQTLLDATDEGSFCCGYTYAVAVEVAQARGLLDAKSVEDLRRFLKLWYGAPGGDRTLVVQALEELEIGHAVALEEAQPGDFVQLWRTTGSGHSVVFLEWVEERGERVGFRYRSSQPATDGVGDVTEFFADAGGHGGKVLRAETYVGRLNEGLRP